MIDLFFQKSRSDRPPLRIGLVLDSYELPRVFAEQIDGIHRCNFARLELVVMTTTLSSDLRARHARSFPDRIWSVLGDATVRRRLLYSLYERWDRERVSPSINPRALVDYSAQLTGIDTIPIMKDSPGFHAEVVEAIRAKNLDVLVRFGFNTIPCGILAAARFGVWSYHYGDNDCYRGAPAHLWELVEHNPVSGVSLQILKEKRDDGKTLCKGLFATEPGGISASRNRIRPYWASAVFLIQKLFELHQYGWEHVEQRIAPPVPYRGRKAVYCSPNNREMVAWLAPLVLRKAARRTFRWETVQHWKTAVRVGARALPDEPCNLRGFVWLKTPEGHAWADPFLFRWDKKTWVFVEDYLYGDQRGVIACAEILAGGRLSPVVRVLDNQYHTSYPFVFSDAGEVYMIPETCANCTIDLYRAVRFPYEWVHEKTLLAGVKSVDTTVWVEDGTYWFFTTVVEPRGYGGMLMLFSAPSLTGNWKLHPDNPVSADVRTARGAGSIFRWGGRLLRPCQDGSRGYGCALNFQEIVELTRTRYRELPVATVRPWLRGQTGTHTYNACEGLEVIDGSFRYSVKRLGSPRVSRTPPQSTSAD